MVHTKTLIAIAVGDCSGLARSSNICRGEPWQNRQRSRDKVSSVRHSFCSFHHSNKLSCLLVISRIYLLEDSPSSSALSFTTISTWFYWLMLGVECSRIIASNAPLDESFLRSFRYVGFLPLTVTVAFSSFMLLIVLETRRWLRVVEKRSNSSTGYGHTRRGHNGDTSNFHTVIKNKKNQISISPRLGIVGTVIYFTFY